MNFMKLIPSAMVQRICLVIGSMAVNPPPKVEKTIRVSLSGAISVQSFL